MVSRRSQLSLLIWKNYKLQRRRPVGTCCEIILPILFFLILAFTRPLAPAVEKLASTACHVEVSPNDWSYEFRNGCIQAGDDGDSYRGHEQSFRGQFGERNSGAPPLPPDAGPLPPDAGPLPLDAGPLPPDAGNIGPHDQRPHDPNPGLPPLDIKIFYAPATVAAAQVVQFIENQIGRMPGAMANENVPGINFTYTAASDEATAAAMATEAGKGIAIIFRQSSGSLWTTEYQSSCPDTGDPCSPAVSFDLRLPQDCFGRFSRRSGDQEWMTGQNVEEFEEPGMSVSGPYTNCVVFVTIQAIIETSLTQYFHPNQAEPTATPRLKPFPYPDYVENTFVSIVKTVVPTVLILSYLYPVISLVRMLVMEKETRIKEAMLMMGLPSWINWLSWFIKSFFFMSISTILIVVLLFQGEIFVYSEPGWVLLFFMLFTTSTIAFCFMVSTFFSAANMAAISGGVIFFVAFIPYFIVQPVWNTLTEPEKMASCLLSPTCAGVGLQLIANYEISGQGLTANTVFEDPTERDTLSAGKILGILFADTLLYIAIAFYIERVMPGEYGIPLKPWFFVLPSFWSPSRFGAGARDDDATLEAKVATDSSHEAEPEGLRVGIELQELRKVFGSKVAVDSISLRMFQEQVTVLLGHNGAGKSTTMSMMVGLFQSTSGDVKINGHSVSSDLNRARQSLGLCPQFDVLWDSLTVSEHLYFFGRLKGLGGKGLQKEIASFLKDLELGAKGDSRSGTLSGGQKRALSVGIALIGGSETVILDEPTSGMDPQKRRHTWDLLLKHKKGRTILLTTHFMDEADLLGDRIAIMSEGKVYCAGSSTFLKQRYGVGYHLTMAKEDGCDTQKVITYVKAAIPSASLADDVGSEITIILPTGSSGSFAKLFTGLETSQASLRVESFGVSVSTLEEVFLNVGGHDDESSGNRARRRSTIRAMQNTAAAPARGAQAASPEPVVDASATTVTLALRLRQFRAMFTKRAIHSLRHWRMILTQIVLPVAFCAAAMGAASVEPPTADVSCRVLSLDSYEPGKIRWSAVNTAGNYHSGFSDALKADLAEAGARTPTTKQTQLGAAAAALIQSSFGGGHTAVDGTGRNMTAQLLSDADSFLETNYMKTSIAAISIEQSVYRIDSGDLSGECKFFGSDGKIRNNTLITLRPGLKYQFASPASHWKDINGDRACFAIPDPNAATGNCKNLEQNQYPVTSITGGWLQSEKAKIQIWDTTGMSDGATAYYYCGNLDTEENTNTDVDGVRIALSDTEPMTVPTHLVYAWFNTKAIHSAPEALNLASNVIAAEHLGGEPRFQARNCPLPKKQKDAFADVQKDNTPFVLAVLMLLAFSFMAASFSMFLVTERVSLAKHVQFVSGVNAFVYWVGSLAWDAVNISVSNVCLIAVIAAFNNDAFSGNLGAVFMALELFGLAVLPFVYLMSFRFSDSSSAFAWLSVMFFMLSFASLLSVYVLSLRGLGYVDTAFTIKYISFFNPVFTVSMVFYDIYTNHNYKSICVGDLVKYCQTQGYYPVDDVFAYEDHKVGGVGKHMLALGLTGIIYFVMLMLSEYVSISISSASSASKTASTVPDEDSDVTAERQLVQSGKAPADSLVVVDSLRRNFGAKKAVQGLSFVIGKGECFGLLGVNGAGKTTSFKMLTGETKMSAGSVQMLGLDLRANLRSIRRHVGYCPQFGGLVGTMTGREQLTMFARLRGIDEPKIEGIVSTLMQNLNFAVHADKPSDTYSGGNKRKLSTAIALIGKPSVIFLDEPTTGMDPGTRRYLWNVLMQVVKDGRSIVLTSHSMEECEALCTRLAIMVDGQFKCLGSSQHLKTKFSEGYQINLICGRHTEDKEATLAGIKAFTAECFPDAKLLEAHGLMLSYQVPVSYRWSELFEYVEQASKIFTLEDHTISQSSLEQIFLKMAHGSDSPVTNVSGGGSNRRISVAGSAGPVTNVFWEGPDGRLSVASSAGSAGSTTSQPPPYAKPPTFAGTPMAI